MINDILHLVVRANLTASVAVLAVAPLRRTVRRVFGASAAYGLWAIPLLMGLASLVPAPEGGPIAPILLRATRSLPAVGAIGSGSTWPAMVGVAWACGALAYATVLLIQQLRFALALRGASAAASEGRSVIRAARTDIGPAAVGCAIILPADFETRYAPAEQAAIIAHEAQHLAQGDVVANAVLALVQCLCWFNPLAHLAAHWIRLDQELACDAAVIARRPGLRRPYAEALLNTPVMALMPPVACAWRPREFHALRDRIQLLKQRAPSRPRRACGALLLALLILGGGFTAWAAQAAPGRTITNPDWTHMPTAADLAQYYPRRAMKRGVEGFAAIRCRVERAGALSACVVLRETPEGYGFGEATLRLAPMFRMRPMSVDGRPVDGGVVVIPIKFKLAK